MARPKKLAAEAHNQDDALLAGSPEGLARTILESAARDHAGKLAALATLWAARAPATSPAAMPPPANASAPLLSICIPTYQRPEYLFALLLTLAAEFAAATDLGARIEVIVVDNASGDLTAGVVEIARAGIPQLSYHQNEFNLGPDPNFLKALHLARGEYEWLLGDDELVLPGGLAGLVRELERHAPAHLYLNFELITIQRDRINRDFLEILGQEQVPLLSLLKRIGYVRGFALISAHVFRTSTFRGHCEPDLVGALSYYPLVPVLLKAFAGGGSCRQLFDVIFTHRVNNRFPDQLAVNHTRVFGVLRVLTLLMDKYRVLTPTDVSEIREYACECHSSWFLVDELVKNCRRLLTQRYALPIAEMDLMQGFFERVGGSEAARFTEEIRLARSERDRPVMVRAAIAARSARFSALFLVENGAHLGSLPDLLPQTDEFRCSVEMICLMVNSPLDEGAIGIFDQVISAPLHLYPHRSELVNELVLQARSEGMLLLLVNDDGESLGKAVARLLATFERFRRSPTGTIEPRLVLADRPSLGPALELAVRRAIAHGLDPLVLPPEVEAIGLTRSRFIEFRGCDLKLYGNSTSLALLDLAHRSRRTVAWMVEGGDRWPDLPADSYRAKLAAVSIYWIRRRRKYPIQESELLRKARLSPPRTRGPGASATSSGFPVRIVLRELFGFFVPSGRKIRTAGQSWLKKFSIPFS